MVYWCISIQHTFILTHTETNQGVVSKKSHIFQIMIWTTFTSTTYIYFFFDLNYNRTRLRPDAQLLAADSAKNCTLCHSIQVLPLLGGGTIQVSVYHCTSWPFPVHQDVNVNRQLSQKVRKPRQGQYMYNKQHIDLDFGLYGKCSVVILCSQRQCITHMYVKLQVQTSICSKITDKVANGIVVSILHLVFQKDQLSNCQHYYDHGTNTSYTKCIYMYRILTETRSMWEIQIE